MAKHLCQAALLLVVVVLLSISDVHSIVLGHTALPGTAPYIIAVREVTGLGILCAGALLKSNWVLSTADCVNGKTEAELSILYGSHRLLTNKRGVLVSQIVQHPSYDTTTGAHNLALLKLQESVSITLRTDTIDLNDVSVVSGLVSTFYGWGALTYGSTSYSNTLQALLLRTLSTKDCSSLITNLAEGNICASIQPGQAPCSKDEGGPLVSHQTGKLVGIYSYGTQCSGRVPDVFVDVYIHKSWIDTVAV